jgi:RNA polymerase sigma factor (sigma-70 family)
MSNTPLSLLERIRADRDETAWREFDGIYRPMLRRYARACGAADGDIEDIVQGCMTAIHAHISGFEHDARIGRFRAWLRTMVRNRVLNQLARRGPVPADADQLAQTQRREILPEEEFERIWWAEHLRYYLGRIRGRVDARTFDAFTAHVIEQQSVKQVCAKYDLSPNTLYKIKWRVTEMLREQMRSLIDDEP